MPRNAFQGEPEKPEQETVNLDDGDFDWGSETGEKVKEMLLEEAKKGTWDPVEADIQRRADEGCITARHHLDAIERAREEREKTSTEG